MCRFCEIKETNMGLTGIVLGGLMISQQLETFIMTDDDEGDTCLEVVFCPKCGNRIEPFYK